MTLSIHQMVQSIFVHSLSVMISLCVHDLVYSAQSCLVVISAPDALTWAIGLRKAVNFSAIRNCTIIRGSYRCP